MSVTLETVKLGVKLYFNFEGHEHKFAMSNILHRLFHGETDILRPRVREVILSKKSQINRGSIRLRYRGMYRNDYLL
jgi:hypothetical protein